MKLTILKYGKLPGLQLVRNPAVASRFARENDEKIPPDEKYDFLSEGLSRAAHPAYINGG